MKFKVDENLPVEVAQPLKDTGFETNPVFNPWSGLKVYKVQWRR